MISEKRIVLDEHGLDTLLLKIFRVVEDTYMRRTEFPTNPLENISFEIRDDGCLWLIYDASKTVDLHTYGFELDMDESDPNSMITYIADNEFYTSAKMNYQTGRFSYGSWSNAFFIKNLKVVMLKYDGTVDYEINKNDYTKKVDGTASDVGDAAYPGNVMIGIPKVYIKVDTSVDRYPKFYFASHPLDNTYHAYAHTDANGNVQDYIYISAYDGWKDSSNRIRSISGKTPTGDETATNQITQCRANNLNSDNIWDMGALAERQLITLLLMLISGSTNSQAIFGNGNCVGAVLPTGSMNDKGLFWGSDEDNLGVKVFGIENFWGNVWKRTHGIISDHGVIKYKLTRGTANLSISTDYNTTGSGYFTLGELIRDDGTSGFITDMYVGDFGLLPKVTSDSTGSATTYYCDTVFINPGLLTLGVFGGNTEYKDGMFHCRFIEEPEDIYDRLTTSLSCKPPAEE